MDDIWWLDSFDSDVDCAGGGGGLGEGAATYSRKASMRMGLITISPPLVIIGGYLFSKLHHKKKRFYSRISFFCFHCLCKRTQKKQSLYPQRTRRDIELSMHQRHPWKSPKLSLASPPIRPVYPHMIKYQTLHCA